MKEIEIFEEKANEILERFLESLHDDDYTIDISNEDENSEFGTHIAEGFTFVYTKEGARLASEMIRRLYKIGNIKFPKNDIQIESHLFREL